jgi:hypothetical protein
MSREKWRQKEAKIALTAVCGEVDDEPVVGEVFEILVSFLPELNDHSAQIYARWQSP